MTRIEELEANLRMIVSHATMGRTDGEGQSVNDICVQITALRNELYEVVRTDSDQKMEKAGDKERQRCLEIVWETCCENGRGPYSEGFFDACEKIAQLIQETSSLQGFRSAVVSTAAQTDTVSIPRDRLLKLLEYSNAEYVPNSIFAEFRRYLVANPA